MKKTTKGRYCRKCGSKLRLVKREGHFMFDSPGIGTCYYRKEYSAETGKELRLWECPNWKLVEKGWFFKRLDSNNHDFYSEE